MSFKPAEKILPQQEEVKESKREQEVKKDIQQGAIKNEPLVESPDSYVEVKEDVVMNGDED